MTNHSALRRTKPPVLRTNSGQTLEDPNQLIEVQREAEAKDYRDTKPSVIQLHLLFVFSYDLDKELSVVCPTVFPMLETLFSRAGMKLVEENFTYGEGCD